MGPLQLLCAVAIALTAADGQLSRDIAFSTRIYISPLRALPDEPLNLDCESFLDLISDDYFNPDISYQGTKRLRLVRGLLSGAETVVAEMRDTDTSPRLLDTLFQDAEVWGFFHLKRMQQINVTVPQARCEHTGPYWCQAQVMVDGRLLEYRSKPREFLIPRAGCDVGKTDAVHVYPTLTLSPDLVSLEDLNASLTLKCSLDAGRKNRMHSVTQYAITFHGSLMAEMDKAGRISVSDSYKSRNLTVKGRASIFPPYLQVTLPAIDCSDLGAYRCSVQATDYFGSKVTVHALENLRHSDGGYPNEDLCPLEVTKSSNLLQAGLPFSLTCSTAVGRLASRQYSQARISEVKMFRKSGTEVTVAVVTKTGARTATQKPGERARGMVSTRVLSLQYEVDRAGCEHVGVYWCTARVNSRVVKGPSNFFGYPCVHPLSKKDVPPNMALAVDMASQAKLQNRMSVSCLLTSKDVMRLNMAKIVLNDQEVLKARHGMELETRGQYRFHGAARTEAIVRYQPTSSWIGAKLATTPFCCGLTGRYTCTLTFTTLANKSTTLTSTAMNLPPLRKALETRVYVKSASTIVNCSGIFETPGSTFQPQYRYTKTDPWKDATSASKMQSGRSRADTCWPQGYDVFNVTSLAKAGMDWQCVLLSPAATPP